MSNNSINKKIIKTLANAPQIALKLLYAQATTEEQKQIEKIAQALKIKI